jgi:hypothetical protein
VLAARIPDAAAVGLGLGLGGDEVGVEPLRVAVLHEVRRHAGAHALDVVVDPLAVLLGEHVGQVAIVAVADLAGDVALDADLGP